MSIFPKRLSKAGWTWSRDWDIPSDTTAGREVLDELLERLAELGWSEDDVFAVHLSVEEALVNAIKHGNRFDPGKRVTVGCRLARTWLQIRIADEGEGFDPAEVPDPTAEENLELPSGRGLMLMRSFMTEVRFSERGNAVHMEKRLTEGD